MMPNPKAGENEKDYVARFMSSEEAKRDYPDQKQRLAVAYSKFRAKKGVIMNITKSRVTIEENLMSVHKSCEDAKVDKAAKEGDTRMIFGKPYKMQSGKWVQTGPNVTTDSAPDTISAEQVSEPEEPEEEYSEEEYDQAFDELMSMGFTMRDIESAGGDAIELLNRAKSEGLEHQYTDEEIDRMSEEELEEDWEDEDYGVNDRGILSENHPDYDPNRDPVMNIEDSLDDPDRGKEFKGYLNKQGFNDIEIANMSPETIMFHASNFENEANKSKNCMDINKSQNTIRKNLAGAQDALKPHGTTLTTDNHSHSYVIDRDGNGATTGMIGEYSVDHIHEIKNYEVKPAQNHTHDMLA